MSDSDSAVVQMPRPNNAFANSPIAQLSQVAHGSGTGNSVVEDVHNAMDPLNINHAPQGSGIESDKKDDAARSQVNEQQHQAQLDQVTQDYHASLANMDVTTSNEIQAALATGDPAKAAALLEQSKAGTGIYGIRQMDQKQRQLLSVMPGRAQLSPRYNFINTKAGG